MNPPVRRPRLTANDIGQAAPGSATERLHAHVKLLIPEFEQVHVETADGRLLALTPDTAGVTLGRLRVGDAIECVVTIDQPRVVEARLIDG